MNGYELEEEKKADLLAQIVAYIEVSGPQSALQLSRWGVDNKIEQRHFHDCLDRGILVLDKDLKFALPVSVEIPEDVEKTSFEDFKKWRDKVHAGEWSWYRNTRCKYITLHLDTRREGYTFTDRDGKLITFAQLCWQYSKDTPTPP